MMRVIGWACVLVVLLPLRIVRAESPDSDPQAVRLLKKIIEAQGGSEVLNRNQKVYRKVEVSLPEGGPRMIQECWVDSAARQTTQAIYLASLPTVCLSKETTIGTEGWIKNGDGPVERLPPSTMQDRQLSDTFSAITSLTPILADNTIVLRLEPEATIETQDCFVLAVEIPDKMRVVLSFQKSNLALLRVSRQDALGSFKGRVVEVLHSDFQMLSGRLVARRAMVRHDGKLFGTVRTLELTLLDKIPPEVLVRPESSPSSHQNK
jgi:hypothetical protein